MRRVTPLLMIFAVALAVATTVVAQGGPKAVPAEPIKDFDIVPRGEVIVHDFVIKNEGSAVLELRDVRPACGCTVAQYDKKIAPGESGKISAKVKTDNFGGPIAKSIAVFTNDPENPKLQLVVKANVKPYIVVTPGYARYNYVQGEPVGTIQQTLWAEDASDLEIVSVNPPYDHLKVRYREATEEERHEKGKGTQWHIEVELDPQSPVGALRDYVEVKLNHSKQKTVRIPVSGFVRPRQHITPAEIDFGQLQGSALPLRRTLHFTNFITSAIELTDIETGIAGLSGQIQNASKKTDTGYRFKLLLTLGPDMPKGKFESTIKVHTTDEQNPIVELPVKGTVL